MANLQYVIELLRRGDGATQAADDLRRLDAQAARTSGIVGGLTSTFGRFFTVFAGYRVLRSSVREFAEAERALAKVGMATGRAAEEFKKLDEASRAIQTFKEVLGAATVSTFGTPLAWLFRSLGVAQGPSTSDIVKQAQDFEAAQKLADKLILQTQAEVANTRTEPAGMKGDLDHLHSKAIQARREAKAAASEIEQTIRNLESLDAENTDKMLDNNQQLLDARLRRIQIEEDAEIKKRKGILTTAEISMQVAEFSAQEFSAGFAHAFTDFISGAKSAQEAFQEFGANFLRLVAEMILQLVIFQAIKRAAISFGFGFAHGGFATPIRAAHGVAGVMPVNSPTLFPRYNILAGEAGPEVMAVLAHPRPMAFGGINAVVGDVQGNKVAMTNADDLANARNGSGRVTLHVVANVDPRVNLQFQAEAADLAVQKVNANLMTDTPTSQAVKRLST